jgi:hypothetical protein
MRARTGQLQGRHALGSSAGKDPGLSTHPSFPPSCTPDTPGQPQYHQVLPFSASAAWPVSPPPEPNSQPTITTLGAMPACTWAQAGQREDLNVWGVTPGPHLDRSGSENHTHWISSCTPHRDHRPQHEKTAAAAAQCVIWRTPHNPRNASIRKPRVRVLRRQACAPQQLFTTGSSQLLHQRPTGWAARAAFCRAFTGQPPNSQRTPPQQLPRCCAHTHTHPSWELIPTKTPAPTHNNEKDLADCTPGMHQPSPNSAGKTVHRWTVLTPPRDPRRHALPPWSGSSTARLLLLLLLLRGQVQVNDSSRYLLPR